MERIFSAHKNWLGEAGCRGADDTEAGGHGNAEGPTEARDATRTLFERASLWYGAHRTNNGEKELTKLFPFR